MYFGLAFLSFASFVIAQDVPKTHGVPPMLLARYVPSSARTWACLDGSKEIPWSAVNDDYCDCLDGSDEPGTGACPNSTFYCRNVGHLGATVPSSRVRDGLCEPECCDGSDERPGVCADTCKDVGEAHRVRAETERKLRKSGSKIRSSYITFAQKEKARLEGVIVAAKKELSVREVEVARLKDIVDRAEALSAEALELKMQSPLYTSLIEHANALRSLRREYRKHQEREKTLGDILDALRRGYNPNYQDMAVLEAVRGWEYVAKLPHIGQEKTEDDVDEEQIDGEDDEALEDGMWSARDLKEGLDSLLETDYVSLLLEHDKHASIMTSSSLLYDPSAYLPDAFVTQYEALRDSTVRWLRKFGLLGVESSAGASIGVGKEALAQAERDFAKTKQELDDSARDLNELFDPKFFGAQGEWRKLANQCLSKNTGDYTYEVCFFGEARQKPNNGGQTFSLGHFSGWNDAATVGSPEYYGWQMYTLGTKCWNGPQRSVKFELRCGIENMLLTVQELEKCEYQFTGTTPALCLPLGVFEYANKEEL
ncbi:glucosidase II beta subunit-like-domain-containing protein [Vararia minispora EC-137]|uniref:Glucosidase II beta subunit-like-domain-containing protein n=1 Tax=Vararia minispora EC-137 TaxID=1314806 RepID=A0ACB8QRB1_9AGAM|nr:glucosidase II beta subunit-like-domain-containing protein [Vararia minispora EC-137]